jgi:hypothetical protein
MLPELVLSHLDSRKPSEHLAHEIFAGRESLYEDTAAILVISPQDIIKTRWLGRFECGVATACNKLTHHLQRGRLYQAGNLQLIPPLLSIIFSQLAIML